MAIIFSLLILTGVHCTFHQPSETILHKYQQANRLFDLAEPNEKTDSLAIAKYLLITRQIRPEEHNARMLFNCYQKAAILQQTYGYQQEALASFKNAIRINKTYTLGDSLLYESYLYVGSAYYHLHSFDSCVNYFEQAEDILLRFPFLEKKDYLYNSFGVVYFEGGNFQQSINYFYKALQFVREDDKRAVYDLKSNIATSLIGLEQYDSAIAIYRSLLPLTINRDALYLGLGTTYLEKNMPDSALTYLLMVEDSLQHNRIALYNKIGKAYLLKGKYKTAYQQLQKAIEWRDKLWQKNGKIGKNNHTGLTYSLLGDVAMEQHDRPAALRYYQQSVIQLDHDFNDTLIYHNPKRFATGFSSFSLYESLVAKARCLTLIYYDNQAVQYLDAAIDTYQSAFAMANFIIKSFDNQDARLFIGQKVFPAYQEIVTLLIGANEQTHHRAYLERAFIWSEKSKAITLNISIKENSIKSYANLPDSLLQEERNLKFNLSRLFLKIDHTEDGAEIKKLQDAIVDNELALSRLQDHMHDYPDYYRKKFRYDSLKLATLQENILDDNTAFLSYFHTDTILHLFVLRADRLTHHKIFESDAYLQAIAGLVRALHTIEPGRKYKGSFYARMLYNKLIRPAEKDLEGITSLVIAPHLALSMLPFEALETPGGEYMVEQYDITYQYTAYFLQENTQEAVDLDHVIAMAPFNQMMGTDSLFLPLLSSEKELTSLDGVKLKGKDATKANFFTHVQNASVVHLATHAVANSKYPSRSYIVFYPQSAAKSNYKLFAHELYNISLKNVQLVFLSACETASGKLAGSEGIMSLSRAFAFAGCSNLVTSLWKAEDNASAYISERFYAHLKQERGYAKALQKAKIDFLKNNHYAQFHAPNYWSHFIFIGTVQADPDNKPVLSYVSVGTVFILLLMGMLAWRVRDVNIK